MAEARDTVTPFVEAFNAHDQSVLGALSTHNARLQASGSVGLEGRDAVTGHAMAWIKGFPDAEVTIGDGGLTRGQQGPASA